MGFGAVLVLQPKVVYALVQRIPQLRPKEHVVDVHHEAVLCLHREYTLVDERRVPAMCDLQRILPGQEQVIGLVNDPADHLQPWGRVAPLLECD